jgi:hypothetical protein
VCRAWALLNFSVTVKDVNSEGKNIDVQFGEFSDSIAQPHKVDFDIVGSSTGGGPSNPETPIPAALPLFAGGLGVLGLLARRRKHKNAAALAT